MQTLRLIVRMVMRIKDPGSRLGRGAASSSLQTATCSLQLAVKSDEDSKPFLL